MLCLKCGKDTKSEQVFCAECLAVMDRYPVRPDVHVQLPHRNRGSAIKKGAKKKRTPSPEELLEILRVRNRRLTLAILALVLMLATTVFVLSRKTEVTEIVDNLGKNYTVETPTE